MSLLDEIDAFLERSGMSPTAFGLETLNDPALVPNLREGRDPKWSTVEKLRTFMAEWQPKIAPKSVDVEPKAATA